jgi:uncharacterized protein (DUF2147 family)
MRSSLSLTVFLAATFLPATTFAAPPNGVRGDWKTDTGSIVRIEPCGSAVCLTVVKLSPTSPETTDQQNPNARLRNRPLCDLVVGDNFEEPDPSHLTEGKLYDPQSGHTYKGTITAAGDTLRLRGYIGISVFGRTETWHRVPTVTACR